MRVFITGGMGFIGSYIVIDLLKNGHEVTILARNPAKVQAFQRMNGITVVQGGLTDYDVIANHLPGHDACIHNALYWGNTAIEMLNNDTRCSVQLFEIAAKAGVKHMIYTSSTAAMGEFRPQMQEEMKLKPTDFYGATKASTEAFLLAFASNTKMRCNIVRPGYTIGNPVVPGASIYSDTRFKEIVKNALAGAAITVTKHDGTQFIWAGDLAKIFTAALQSDINRAIYFGLSKNFTTWEEIARKAIQMTESKSKIVVDDEGKNTDPVLFDLSKIEREFGFIFNSSKEIENHLKYLIEEAGLRLSLPINNI